MMRCAFIIQLPYVLNPVITGRYGNQGIGMRSEFQYFMSQEDHAGFDEHLRSLDGVSVERGKNFDEILYSDGSIQYERSQLLDGVLTAGRIAIATTDLDGNFNFTAHDEIETIYKKLRNWLKKRSMNNLVCFNENSQDRVTQATKNFWLANGAELSHKEQGIRLKQFYTGNVAFKLA